MDAIDVSAPFGRAFRLLKARPGIVVSYILPILTAFVLGKLGVSSFIIISLLLTAVVVSVYGIGRWMRLERAVAQQPAEIINRPAWLLFPDVERAQWANLLIELLWDHVCKEQEPKLQETLNKALLRNKPALLSALFCSKMHLGDDPPQISAVKGYYCNDNEYMLDLNILATSNPKIQITGRAAGIPADLNFSIENLQIEGTLRIVCKDITDEAPYVGSLGITIIELPKIDFDIHTIGMNITSVPGVQSTIERILKVEIFKRFLFPEVVEIPLRGKKTTPRRAPPTLRRQPNLIGDRRPSIKVGINAITSEDIPGIPNYDACIDCFVVSRAAWQELSEALEWFDLLENKEHDLAAAHAVLSPRGSEPVDPENLRQNVAPLRKLRTAFRRARTLAQTLTSTVPSPTVRYFTGEKVEVAKAVRTSQADIDKLMALTNAPMNIVARASVHNLRRLCLLHWSAIHKQRAEVSSSISSGSWDDWQSSVCIHRFPQVMGTKHHTTKRIVQMSVKLHDRSQYLIVELFLYSRHAEERHFAGIAPVAVADLLDRNKTGGGESNAAEAPEVQPSVAGVAHGGVRLHLPVIGTKAKCLIHVDIAILSDLHRRKISAVPKRESWLRQRGKGRRVLREASERVTGLPPKHPEHYGGWVSSAPPAPLHDEERAQHSVQPLETAADTEEQHRRAPLLSPSGGEPFDVLSPQTDQSPLGEHLASQVSERKVSLVKEPWIAASRKRSMTMMAELGSIVAAISLCQPPGMRDRDEGAADDELTALQTEVQR